MFDFIGMPKDTISPAFAGCQRAAPIRTAGGDQTAERLPAAKVGRPEAARLSEQGKAPGASPATFTSG